MNEPTVGFALIVAALIAPWVIGPGSARAAGDAASIVQNYYRNVAIYDYEAAYRLLGASFHASQPYDQFVKGYSDTAYVEVVTSGTQSLSGGRERVAVEITAWHNDATIHRYSGTYDVGPENGADRILDAGIVEGDKPTDVASLCKAADLNFELVAWEPAAGNRYGTFAVTNQSDATCLTAGVPRFTILDPAGSVLLSSMPEAPNPFTSVSLAPGKQSTVELRWVNWCGEQPSAALTLSIDVPGDTQAIRLPFVAGGNPIGPPPCLGSGVPSTLTDRPFAPETA